jgi:gliding motility-associated-like protein
MKKLKPLLLYCLLAFFSCLSAHAQSSHCTNLGFELGDFTNWVGYNWLIAKPNPQTPASSLIPTIVTLPTPRRQVIMTDQTAYDPNTGNVLKIIPPGYKYSARLGDAWKLDAPSDPGVGNTGRFWEESLRYTMAIDSANALLILKFAVVLEDPVIGHTETQEPRFKLTLLDQNGINIQDCANYDVYASSANIKGFQDYISPTRNVLIRWRDWTTVGVNLLKYIGQTITVEFMTADCTLGAHAGYAYFVAECHPLYITVKYCAGDSIASLKAPEGMERYRWTDNNGVVVDTTQIYKVENSIEGATYTCTMTSATGCTVQLQSTIARYDLKTDFTSSMLDCRTNKVQLHNSSSTNRGSLLYNWDFGDGNTSPEKEPAYTFATSGRHTVSLIVSDPPSACVDTLTKVVESFSPPLVGITGDSTYCYGSQTTLKGYGAWDYTWNDGSKADSLVVKGSGGNYSLIGYSSTGCFSDTIHKAVIEDPDWQFLDQSDTTMCVGTNHASLAVTGADKYLWQTGETSSSIVVTTPGSYSVTGTNTRGCNKSITVPVIEVPLPEVPAITTSPQVLSTRNYTLTCSIPAKSDETYSWDMGDGSTGTGVSIQHTYKITNDMRDVTISLTVTSKYGCIKSGSIIVDVVPFIPNVFTPNGDGINDIFMPDIDIKIMDRFGLVLYDGTAGWDGTYKGRMMSPDTYFYQLHYLDRYQKEHIKKGFITLVR